MNSKDFDEEKALQKPLMLHLATICDEGPRSSPLWFLYENKKIWLFGTANDSFIKRLKAEPKCALTVVDFDLNAGVLLHVGIRGFANLHKVDQKRLNRFVAKYIGEDTQSWNKWFIENIVKPLDVMIEVDSHSVVAKDVSFFKTGPNLASKEWL
jgi:general stress protein 26